MDTRTREGEDLFMKEGLEDISTLEEKARQLKLEYDRAWRKKNPDKVRKYNQNRWLRKAQRLIESQANN